MTAQVSRQQLSADWRKRLQVIQSKAAEAWGSLPPDVASSLQTADRSGPESTPPDYFMTCQVRGGGSQRQPVSSMQPGHTLSRLFVRRVYASSAGRLTGNCKRLKTVHVQARDALAVGAGKTVLGYLKGEAGTWDAIVRAYQSKGDLHRPSAPDSAACRSFACLPSRTTLTATCNIAGSCR